MSDIEITSMHWTSTRTTLIVKRKPPLGPFSQSQLLLVHFQAWPHRRICWDRTTWVAIRRNESLSQDHKSSASAPGLGGRRYYGTFLPLERGMASVGHESHRRSCPPWINSTEELHWIFPDLTPPYVPPASVSWCHDEEERMLLFSQFSRPFRLLRKLVFVLAGFFANLGGYSTHTYWVLPLKFLDRSLCN